MAWSSLHPTLLICRHVAEHYVPEYGKDVRFRIENYAYIDPLGRETVSWVRTFFTKRKRRFDAYMINGLETLSVEVAKQRAKTSSLDKPDTCPPIPDFCAK
ncbi:hypothetical protein HDF16_006180 [Granulicella aggregans]|uniref:DUF4166 domain-containing protein n=1 Tax=Granulicella aggregans TaxID=474949 RepID=A0A7W8E7I4_9BACT|nr:hypothetical protein [Granulicella aggregans]